MDKETLSNYGWIVICVLVLAVMIALATPFGNFIAGAIKSTTQGLFDVNQGALDAAGIVMGNQSFGDSESNTPKETSIWEEKTWNGLTNFGGDCVWTDGANTYYSIDDEQYVLNGDTWEEKTWNGFQPDGRYIWTDGTNIYYSCGLNQYILNGDTWEKKTWNGYNRVSGSEIWTDGTNIYFSSQIQQNVLNGDTWETKGWENAPYNLRGIYIWTDGTNIYFNDTHILNGDTWEEKTWNVVPDGRYIWTDGTNTYYSNSDNSYETKGNYVLNKETSIWEEKTWNGLTSFSGEYVWTDGTNTYYSNGTDQYVLVK